MHNRLNMYNWLNMTNRLYMHNRLNFNFGKSSWYWCGGLWSSDC